MGIRPVIVVSLLCVLSYFDDVIVERRVHLLKPMRYAVGNDDDIAWHQPAGFAAAVSNSFGILLEKMLAPVPGSIWGAVPAAIY